MRLLLVLSGNVDGKRRDSPTTSAGRDMGPVSQETTVAAGES